MAVRSEFNAGYLLACINVASMHGEETIAADVLAEASISEGEIAAMGLCENDSDALREIRASRSDDPIVGRSGAKKAGAAG